MKGQEKIVRFCVSLPQSLLSNLDSKIISRGYTSRSEFIRDVIRELMVEEKWEKGEDVIGILIMIYDHHKRGLTEKMLKIQHSEFSHILCSTHIHLDHNNCLETIIIRGKPEDIESTAIKIGGLNGVKFSKLVKTAQI